MLSRKKGGVVRCRLRRVHEERGARGSGDESRGVGRRGAYTYAYAKWTTRHERRTTGNGATKQRGNGAADDGCVRKVEIIEVDKYLFGIDGAWIAKPFALSDRFLRFCSTLVHLSAK